MVQKIRRLMGRVDMRVLCLLLLGGLVGSLAFAAVQLTREQSEDFDARTINTWAQLTKEFTDFRESSYPLVIPAMLPDDSAIDWAALQNDDSEWYWDFDCGTYYFDPGSEISKQIPHDTELMVYEDIATEELLVLSVPKTLGAPYKEEMVFRASAWPQPSRFERYQRYIDRELNKRRIVWHVTMKSRRQAEREAALTASQPVMALDEGGGSMQMMSMESVTELKITNIRKATNGVELTISYPSSGYSGSVWSVYSYDAPACAYTNESGGGGGGGIPPPPDDTNEITEITGSCCEIDFSKRFQGLDNVWTLAKSNLVLSGVSNTLWLDARPMAVDTNGEPCNRFLGLGNNGINPDNDGLSSASELYIHKTNPALADTDGDGASDGAEVRFGTNPLNNPGDSDADGLSDDLEICIGTSISSQDTDLDWFGDAYEYGIGASPTNANERPILRMVINNLDRFASHTNLAVGFPGTVAEAVAIAESNDLSGTLSRPISTNCAYSLISETNGSRLLYARLYRNTIEQSPLIEGHIVFDNVSPSFGSLDPTNCAVTDRRWIKLAGLATDNLSRAHVLIDGQWADGIVNDEFVYDRYKLTAGTNLIALAAVDEAGNVATQQLAIVLDASGDTHAPIASLSLPRDYQIVDGQTNWFDTTTFGSNKILYVYGSVDDETADVHIQVHSGVQSSEVFEAVVDSNILWAAIEVYPGTNSLILTAADAAGNATTSSYCVVRDTNITLEIISPSAYQVINATNVTVVVRALPGFSSGSISVNGIGVAGGFFGIFSTTKKVPLNTQLTSLIVTATRNGRSYYADPPPIGYEILSYHREEVVHSHSYPCGSEPMNENWTDTYEVRNWDAVSLRDATVKTGTLSHILIGGSLETFPVYQQSSRAQSLPVCDVRLGELTSFTLHDDLEGGLLATDEHLEYGSAVTFTKHAAKEETQLVVFQFQDLSCNLDTPSDPSQITFRQARGFWYNDNVSFVVPMRTKIAQTITERDFTWPAHHRTFCNTGFNHEYCAIFEHDDHYLTFEGFHNEQLSVDFVELWETSNRVNQVFNPTLKDDPPPTACNKIYVVESPDSLYHVTLDVNDQPSSMRSKLMYAVFMDGAKLSGSDGFFPAIGPADITFDHPSLSAMVEKDFELRVGYDMNGDSTLDSAEVIPISVTNAAGTVIGPPIARGTSSPRYPVAMTVVDAAVLDTLTLPHASWLLRIFRDATTTGLPTDKAPTASSTISFNCYSDSWAVWLTHNAGVPFNASGTATIQQYVWGTNTSLADLVAKSHQMKAAAESVYNSTVLTAANAFFATNPVGTIATFPLDGTSYNVPHIDESPTWVSSYLSGVTVVFDEPTQINGFNDDINGTIGRGRVLSHTATYTIEKVDGLFGPKLILNSVHYTGAVEDLYDFNRDGGGAGEEAAIIQLGYGNGGYGSGRYLGIIFKDRIEIDQSVPDPF